jgi:hypothetical protein
MIYKTVAEQIIINSHERMPVRPGNITMIVDWDVAGIPMKQSTTEETTEAVLTQLCCCCCSMSRPDDYKRVVLT